LRTAPKNISNVEGNETRIKSKTRHSRRKEVNAAVEAKKKGKLEPAETSKNHTEDTSVGNKGKDGLHKIKRTRPE